MKAFSVFSLLGFSSLCLTLGAALVLPMAAIAQAPQEQPVLGPGNVPNSTSMTWLGVAGRVYFVQCSPDMEHWDYTPIVSLGAGVPIPWYFSTAAAAGVRTYLRVKYTNDTNYTADVTGDIDGDGLTNGAEVITHHTDPFAVDSDNDGMPDDWEVQYALNPIDNDAATDADGDTLSNFQEYQLGTKPNGPGSTDSDSDGLSDQADTAPAMFDMPIISLMEYSREVTLEDWHQPSFANRHTWQDGSYRSTSVTGTNGSGASKLSPPLSLPTGFASPNSPIFATAYNAFLNEEPGALAWGNARSTGTTINAWLKESWHWEDPYRVQRLSARQIRYFLRADRDMPIEVKVKAFVTRFTSQGAAGSDWGNGEPVQANTLTLLAGQRNSFEISMEPGAGPLFGPPQTADGFPSTQGNAYFTVSIKPFPYPKTELDSDGDGLSNTIEQSMNTLEEEDDTDGDGRTDLVDFISSRPGSLSTSGPGSSADSPTVESEPLIEYVWRSGHICPASLITGNASDSNKMIVSISHWEKPSRKPTTTSGPTSPTQAIKEAWAVAPVFHLTPPDEGQPPAIVYDQTTNAGDFLRSFNEFNQYSGGRPGGDIKETKVRLRRLTAGTRPVSRQFILVDRQKANAASTTWIINGATPYTLTIPANHTISPLVTDTDNPLKLPDPLPGAGGIREKILLAFEYIQASGPAQGKAMRVIPQWKPNSGIGKGPKTGGDPYGIITVTFTDGSATLAAFGQSWTLTQTSTQLWSNAGNGASVELLTPRNSSPTIEESLAMRINAPSADLAAAEYTMIESGASSNSFRAFPPAITLDLPALSASSADVLNLQYKRHFMNQSVVMMETGPASKIFAGGSQVLSLLNNPLAGSPLRVRLAGSATPQAGPVYELQFRNGAWRAHQPTVFTNLPAAPMPEGASWHIEIKGLFGSNSSIIPFELIEEHREVPSTTWITDVLGTGSLTATSMGYRSTKPVVVLSPDSKLEEVTAGDRADNFVVISKPYNPSTKDKKMQARYRIRFTDGSLLPAGTLVLAPAILKPAMVMRSLDFTDEFGQGMDEKKNILKPLEALGYKSEIDLETNASDIDGTIANYLSGKDIVYLMAHGGLTGQTAPVSPLSPSFDLGADFGGMAFQNDATFHLTATWLETKFDIRPSLAMMAGCATGMTTTEKSSVSAEDGFLPGSAAFAESFRSAYVGYAWEQTPKGIHGVMSRFVKELSTTKTYRESFDEYLRSGGSKFLKMYKHKDATYAPNDFKPGEAVPSGESQN